VTVELGRLWNELGEEEKVPYLSEYTKLWKEYKVEMNNHLKSSVKGKRRTDVMDEKEGEDMEEVGDGSIKVLETDDVEVNLEVDNMEDNLEAGDAEVNLEVGNEAGNVEVNLEEIIQEADDDLEEEDIDEK